MLLQGFLCLLFVLRHHGTVSFTADLSRGIYTAGEHCLEKASFKWKSLLLCQLNFSDVTDACLTSRSSEVSLFNLLRFINCELSSAGFLVTGTALCCADCFSRSGSKKTTGPCTFEPVFGMHTTITYTDFKHFLFHILCFHIAILVQ